ncbi:MAG TPA: D-alanine--D-alanine ligase [bacterium]|nr:D-alanine--D-alanine ligase [bacterium]
MYRNKRVGVLLGGPSAEREVSLNTGRAVVTALRNKGYDAVEIDLNETTAETLRREKIDVVYNALHGKWGEDGCVQGLLEILRIPYTGPGVTASAVGMDKVLSKRIFAAEGLPVPAYAIVTRDEREETRRSGSPYGWPVVVKPATEGSSVGVTVCPGPDDFAGSLETAFAADERVLIERYLPGREIQVAVLDNKSLGIVEVRPKPQPGETITFYDYKHKYTKGYTEYITKPEDLSDEQAQAAQRLAERAYRAIAAEGVSRVDLIMDGAGKFWLLEVNTLPGLTALSLVPMIARDWRHIAFDDLVEMVLNTARLKMGA